VGRIARRGLQGQNHQRLGVAKHHILDAWTGIARPFQPGGRDARGGTGDLHQVAPERLKWDAVKRQTNQTFSTERDYFGNPAISHAPNQRDNRTVREVGIPKDFTLFSENFAFWQIHALKLALQPHEIL
jgi:hypothetical protein